MYLHFQSKAVKMSYLSERIRVKLLIKEQGREKTGIPEQRGRGRLTGGEEESGEAEREAALML